MSIWTHSPEDFIQTLADAGVQRGALIWDEDSQALRITHPVMEPIREALLADQRDFDRHEALFFEVGAQSGHLLTGALHRTTRGQGAGGVRYWGYETVENFVRDALRLSRGMGRKSALAGLWWGGGKGVIARRPDRDHLDPDVRSAVFRDYGRFISGLHGAYVTAEDVGTTPADMEYIHATTRFTTCVPPSLGGSGNPSVLTARGVVVAMEAALVYLDRGDLAGKTVAMQGLGNVARYMIEELLARGVARIIAVDIDAQSVATARSRFADSRLETELVQRGDERIFSTACDVLAPNAVGGVLRPDTIDSIRAPIVCGAANNPLEDPDRDARALQDRGILFVPDFLANRMGIVNCANEQYGWIPTDPAVESHLSRDTEYGIYRRCLEVFQRAEQTGATPMAEAERLADELSAQTHPIWGNRTRQLIAYLLSSGWAEQKPISD